MAKEKRKGNLLFTLCLVDAIWLSQGRFHQTCVFDSGSAVYTWLSISLHPYEEFTIVSTLSALQMLPINIISLFGSPIF